MKRLYVQKKKEYGIEGKGVFADIKETMDIPGLKGIVIANRYDIEALDEETYELSKYAVFSEKTVDQLFEEELDKNFPKIHFTVEYLPGQYDMRADAAVQCIKLIKPGAEPKVRYGKVYGLEGDLTKSEVEQIKEYLINPVDSRQGQEEKPKSLEINLGMPEGVKNIEDFLEKDANQLDTLRTELELTMTLEDLLHIQRYYREEKRNPTMTEIRVLDTYWSDHCRHTTFNTSLSDIYFDGSSYGDMVKNAFSEYMEMRKEVYGDRKKPITLMDMACLGTKYLKKQGKATAVDESEEINACSIKVKANISGKEEDWLVMFKNETHNHPTEIEPYGGAATCLGGAIRDPLSGRVYVYQAMRITGSGNPKTPLSETREGKLPQRKITREAARGYSSYGNQIGLATGLVHEIYHDDYVAKRMEVGAVIGAAPASHVRRETPKAGDVIILVGGKTGRDGCGGATGSSKEHTEESIAQCGAEVQKGNPLTERNLQRLFRRKEAAILIKRCNDFGAGGVSVAIGELADGVNVNLDLIPKKYEGLDGTELAISESQERMAVVVSKEEVGQFLSLARAENLEATAVAKVTDDNRMVMTWRGEKIVNLCRDFLNTNGVMEQTVVRVKAPENLEKNILSPEEALKDLNCASQKGLGQRFDSTIGAGTVLMPFGGKYQLSPSMGMAAKLPLVKGETDTTTLMTYGYDPFMAKKNPYLGAQYAVVDSVTKMVALGSDPNTIYLSFQEYFEKLNKEESWGKPLSSLLGALKAQKELEIPAIGGKDSMSGTFEDIHVPPALISFAVNIIEAPQVISTEWKKGESKLIFVERPRMENGEIDFKKYRLAINKIFNLAKENKILSAAALGRGGIFIGAVKMAVGNHIGATLEEMDHSLFLGEQYGSLLLEMGKNEKIEALFEDVEVRIIGRTTEKKSLCFFHEGESVKMGLKEIVKKWEEPLEEIFPVYTQAEKQETVAFAKSVGPKVTGPLLKTPRPKVIIPTFPGTNCEMDTLRAFEKVGAQGEIHFIRNQKVEDLNTSIKELGKKIRESQIIMLPGGFSGGDEPDGSAKFITAIFRNPYISQEVTELLEKREGLMLGICNGFQALIKLGLLPYGKISEITEDSPSLTYNAIGRHESGLVRTRVASTMSPWLWGLAEGDQFQVAISHGEGNFTCSREMVEGFMEKGQVATQYVDFEGKATMDILHNPNHSVMAIEGLTSTDGRIFGKMGHVERIGQNIYRNVPGEKDMKIFERGVNYFK